MFICEFSRELSEPGEKPVRLVIKTRPKSYTYIGRDEETGKRKEMVAHGEEIVKEKVVREKHITKAKERFGV